MRGVSLVDLIAREWALFSHLLTHQGTAKTSGKGRSEQTMQQAPDLLDQQICYSHRFGCEIAHATHQDECYQTHLQIVAHRASHFLLPPGFGMVQKHIVSESM